MIWLPSRIVFRFKFPSNQPFALLKLCTLRVFSTVVATVPRTLTEKHKIQRLEEENERLRDEMLALRGVALRVAADHNNAFPH